MPCAAAAAAAALSPRGDPPPPAHGCSRGVGVPGRRRAGRTLELAAGCLRVPRLRFGGAAGSDVV
jgi:hypothetical protein